MCVLSSAAGTHREAAEHAGSLFIISLPISICLSPSLYSAEVPVAAEAQWPVFTVLCAALKAIHTHTHRPDRKLAAIDW